jgi:hypothetical protein
LRFDIWKAPHLREFLSRYREDQDLELRAICSLESYRNPTVMQEWEAMPPPLDRWIRAASRQALWAFVSVFFKMMFFVNNQQIRGFR